MSSYNHFIGIDIGKFHFVAFLYGNKSTKEYENNFAGIKSFIQEYKAYKKDSLIILEATGGYEMELLLTLVIGYLVKKPKWVKAVMAGLWGISYT